MNKIYLFLVILMTMLISSCNGVNQKKENLQSKTDQSDYIKTTIHVEGMTCTGCEKAINMKINELEGIKSSNSNHTEGITIVEYDSLKTSKKQIITKIEEAGYTVPE